MPKDMTAKFTPNGALNPQPPDSSSSKSSSHISNTRTLVPEALERSLLGSVASSTPRSRVMGEEDKIEPLPPDTFQGHVVNDVPKPLVRRPTVTGNDEAWEKSYVFSFDGGGVRGLSTLYILRRLMTRIKAIERSLDPPVFSSYHPAACPHEVDDSIETTAGYYPCHYIDFMAGTSTGGLIAIMLSRLRMDVDDTIKEFIQLADSIFGKPRIFSIRGPIIFPRPKHDYRILEDAVKQVLERRLPKLRHNMGGPMFSSNPEMCKTMVIAHGKSDEGHEDAHIFRSYDHLYPFHANDSSIRNPGPSDTIEIEKIARATSAAPTYFEAVKIGNRKLGDGGFGCNNPSWEAYNEVQDMHNSDDKAIALLVSIGTGESFVRRFSKAGGYAELFQALRAAKGLATDTHRTDELLRKITRKRKDAYFRFNADERLGKIKLDCWKAARGSKPSTADEIRRITEEYLDRPSVVEEINHVAQILVTNRRMRSKTNKWEERLFGIKWRCVHEGCSEGQQLRRQVELEEHLQTYHDFGPVAEQSPDVRANYEDLVSRGRCELHDRR